MPLRSTKNAEEVWGVWDRVENIVIRSNTTLNHAKRYFQ